MTLHLEDLWIKNLTLTTGLVDTRSTPPTLIKLVASQQIDTSSLVTHRFALSDIEQAYDVFSDAASSGALKVLLSNDAGGPLNDGNTEASCGLRTRIRPCLAGVCTARKAGTRAHRYALGEAVLSPSTRTGVTRAHLESVGCPMTVSRQITASRERVWAVLCDGWTYSGWVVGNSRIRAVGADWPDTGSRILHSIGTWPAVIDDETVVVSVDPGA